LTIVPGIQRRGDYGYDAPYALVTFAVLGVALAVGAVVSWWTRSPTRQTFGLAAYAVLGLGSAGSFFYTTRAGKFAVWNEILDGLRLHGDERVLDLGCGRGAVLNMVAGRLTTGRITGVDLWSTHDQSGNARDVTRRNATLEGVSGRVSVETGDMRALPFPDDTFDLVVSSLAIHNISGSSERAKAISEGWRVLAPGGRLVIADIRATRHYARVLEELGAAAVTRRNLGWRFWYGNPFASTSLVTAVKTPVPRIQRGG
jgi:ubiquinone/menaquinone biosynthesis C-methylase UbiE